jgi:hypothetical protein
MTTTTEPEPAPASAPPRRSWWRRNVWGLVATVVLVPTVLFVTFSAEWGRYYAQRPSQPVYVAAGDPVDFGGATWTLAHSERIEADSAAGRDARLPDGTALIVVEVRVDPTRLDADGRGPGCTVELGEVQPGSEVAEVRRWNDAAFADIDYRTDPANETYCNTDLTRPYTLESIFVVPATTGDDLMLQLQVVSEFPRYLRMSL